MRHLRHLAVVYLLATSAAIATSIVRAPLSEEVQQADIIVFGHVDWVSMHGYFGQKIYDPAALTEPHGPNEIRLHVTLDPHRVLKGKLPSAQVQYVLPTFKSWIRTLRDAQEMYESQEFIFFLTSKMKPGRLATFEHSNLELGEIQSLVRTQGSRH